MLYAVSSTLKEDTSTRELSALKLGAMKASSTLGSRLKQAMSDESVESVQLAEDVGTTEATISNWRNNNVQIENVKGALAVRIAKRLRVRVAWLLLDDGPMREEGVTATPPVPADPWAAIEELSLAQALMAKVLAESIPTAGRALVAGLAKLDPDQQGREYLATLIGTLRRELASQEAGALSAGAHKAHGSGARRRP